MKEESTAFQIKHPESSDEESLVTYGKDILVAESRAVQAVAELLDEKFENAVNTILRLPKQSRLIISGMGKAGFIAMKISATFASTGVPSFFLHPAEAVHGDLGRFTENDASLILSNSGETEEILRMLPAVKRMGCPIISITGTKGSTLGRHSDIVLEFGKLDEAGPLGLAPTTSAAVMLALGDALAMAVLKKQGISREQFALYHPGGQLGLQLTSVSEIMRRGEEHCIVTDRMTTKEVLRRYTSAKGRPGAASVVDGQGRLVGIFTDGDLRRYLAHGIDFLDNPISEVMTRNPKIVRHDHLVQDALHALSKHKIDQVIVVDEAMRPVGLVDIQDLVGINLD